VDKRFRWDLVMVGYGTYFITLVRSSFPLCGGLAKEGAQTIPMRHPLFGVASSKLGVKEDREQSRDHKGLL